MKSIKTYMSILILFLTVPSISFAQSVIQDYQSRFSAGIETKLGDRIRLGFAPQIRFSESFSVDNYHMELNADYKMFKFLSLGAGYRFVGNVRKVKDTEYLHRWAFHAKFSYKLDRFKFQFKPSYTNFNDDLSFDTYFRTRLQVKYNVPKIPLFVVGGAENFRQVKLQQFSKMRYYTGLDYKLAKKHTLSLRYKFDYYLQEYYNKHIFTFAYTYKL